MKTAQIAVATMAALVANLFCMVSTWAAETTAQTTESVMLVPEDLPWTDGPPSMAPGAKIAVIEGDLKKAEPFTFRLKLPPDYKIAPHTHPAIEHVTVLSGTFHFAGGETFDSAKAQALPAGSFAVMPPGHPMFAWTEEETVIQVHGIGPWGITYINPEDDPRKK